MQIASTEKWNAVSKLWFNGIQLLCYPRTKPAAIKTQKLSQEHDQTGCKKPVAPPAVYPAQILHRIPSKHSLHPVAWPDSGSHAQRLPLPSTFSKQCRRGSSKQVAIEKVLRPGLSMFFCVLPDGFPLTENVITTIAHAICCLPKPFGTYAGEVLTPLFCPCTCATWAGQLSCEHCDRIFARGSDKGGHDYHPSSGTHVNKDLKAQRSETGGHGAPSWEPHAKNWERREPKEWASLLGSEKGRPHDLSLGTGKKIKIQRMEWCPPVGKQMYRTQSVMPQRPVEAWHTATKKDGHT